MRVRGVFFPIVLAIAWVLMAAITVTDFADFSAATRPHAAGKVVVCNDAGVTC
jgi:hypothetical protein